MRLLNFWAYDGRATSVLRLAAIAAMCVLALPAEADTVLTGRAAFGDWTRDAPSVTRHITPADLPPPFATESAANAPHIVDRPGEAVPKAPPGFTVELFADGLPGARLLRTAPNGDTFLTEEREGRIVVLHDNGPGKRASVSTYATGLDEPFGLAFYPAGATPQFLYVGTLGAVLRYPYRNGDTTAEGEPEIVTRIPDGGGHRTRDIVFAPDGRHFFVSVGSLTNDAEGRDTEEGMRADILEFDTGGGGRRIFADGIRNPVGLAIDPVTGDLWAAVNERDGLGDNLPPDYVTRVRDGGFYGWPWYYIGDHWDPRHKGEHPELAGRVLVPDVLIQPHSAPLQLAVYTGSQFPASYRNDIFVALHGSWNRSLRTGYKVVRVRLQAGVPTGEYQDFLTGFVTAHGDVWGRPVGVAVAADGSLLVSEDAHGTVWRISYKGK